MWIILLTFFFTDTSAIVSYSVKKIVKLQDTLDTWQNHQLLKLMNNCVTKLVILSTSFPKVQELYCFFVKEKENTIVFCSKITKFYVKLRQKKLKITLNFDDSLLLRTFIPSPACRFAETGSKADHCQGADWALSVLPRSIGFRPRLNEYLCRHKQSEFIFEDAICTVWTIETGSELSKLGLNPLGRAPVSYAQGCGNVPLVDSTTR